MWVTVSTFKGPQLRAVRTLSEVYPDHNLSVENAHTRTSIRKRLKKVPSKTKICPSKIAVGKKINRQLLSRILALDLWVALSVTIVRRIEEWMYLHFLHLLPRIKQANFITWKLLMSLLWVLVPLMIEMLTHYSLAIGRCINMFKLLMRLKERSETGYST